MLIGQVIISVFVALLSALATVVLEFGLAEALLAYSAGGSFALLGLAFWTPS